MGLEDDRELRDLFIKKFGLSADCIVSFRLLRRAVDARNKANIRFVNTLDVVLDVKKTDEKIISRVLADKNVIEYATDSDGKEQMPPIVVSKCTNQNRPIVVGSGPAGIFAALALAEAGMRPIIVERGKPLNERIKDVECYWKTGVLDSESNVQFGEGGAGTFSDGKLTTRINDKRIGKVLSTFVRFGAPEEIAWLQHPHIGTDKLRGVLLLMREHITALGGEYRFESCLTNIFFDADKNIKAVEINESYEIPCKRLVLAVGNSSRDTFYRLNELGVCMEKKPFSIGVRLEHKQSLIDAAQYGSSAGHPKLASAEYQLVYKDQQQHRTAYTFCMCPGGFVIASASEQGTVVTNGMSYHARDGKNANSALVVGIEPSDTGEHVLSGIELQRKCEAAAFAAGGSTGRAPVQTVGDFLADRVGQTQCDGAVEPTYKPGTQSARLADCLPEYVIDMLKKAIPALGRQIKGFDDPAAVMTGVETRTSCPIRILRNDAGQAIGHDGIFPAGEGAGYAGGIMSSAVDGLRSAEWMIQDYILKENANI